MKRMISILLLIAVLVPLCACDQANPGTAPAATPDPQSPQALYGHIDQTQKSDGVSDLECGGRIPPAEKPR